MQHADSLSLFLHFQQKFGNRRGMTFDCHRCFHSEKLVHYLILLASPLSTAPHDGKICMHASCNAIFWLRIATAINLKPNCSSVTCGASPSDSESPFSSSVSSLSLQIDSSLLSYIMSYKFCSFTSLRVGVALGAQSMKIPLTESKHLALHPHLNCLSLQRHLSLF